MSKSLLVAGGVAAAAVGAAFLFAASMESGADVARKPDLADFIVKDSIAQCEVNALNWNHPEGYEMRLNDVLMNTRSTTLDFLIKNHITVCLDQRLENEQYGILGTPPGGIFYPSSDHPVLTLLDNGANPKDHGFFEWTASTRGPTYLGEFKQHFDRLFSDPAKVSDEKAPLFAYSYMMPVSCGKNCTTFVTEYAWKAGDFLSYGDFMQNHPAVSSPPLQQTELALH